MTTITEPLIDYTPRGAALKLFECRDPEVLIVGAAGTGKSLAALHKLNAIALNNPGMRGLIIRKTQVSLTSSGLVTFKRDVIPKLEAAGIVSWYGGSREESAGYRYQNGSKIEIGGLDKSSKVMSTEYDTIFIQEATELTQDDYESLTTRLRNGVVSFQQLIADCNPAEDTHWLHKRTQAGTTTELISRHKDNPILWSDGEWTPKGQDYMDRLDGLSGVRRRRLLDGEWSSAEGVVYEEWDSAVHLIDSFDPPKDWQRFWSVDFGFCVSADTEILTNGGWKYYEDLRFGDQCLSLSPDSGLAEWDSIQEVNIFAPRERTMIAMDNLSHSSLTTVDHKWLIERRNGTRDFKIASQFVADDSVATAAPVVDLPLEPKFSDALVELVAWYWTEGSRWRAGNGNTGGTNTGGFITQNRGEDSDSIRKTLTVLFGPPSETMREGSRKVRTPKWRDWAPRSNTPSDHDGGYFSLNGPALAPVLEWVEGFEKVVRPEFLTALTQAQLELFINTSLRGDGYAATSSLGISQANEARIDMFQMACQLAGYQTVKRAHSRGKYTWWTLAIFTRYARFYPKRLLTEVRHSGPVWCPTTRNGTWLARRNGTVYFTGNTHPFVCQMWAEDDDGRLYLYKEWYKTQGLVSDHAQRLLEEADQLPDYIICDHDAEGRAQLVRAVGMRTVAAKKAVREGIQAVKERLKVAGDGKPRLFIMRDALIERDPRLAESAKPTCTAEEITGYVWASSNTGTKEEPVKEDDHGADCARYMVAHRDPIGLNVASVRHM